MIDTVQTKGQTGFAAFLEVVEYEYPELFTEITGKDPRTPPKGQKMLQIVITGIYLYILCGVTNAKFLAKRLAILKCVIWLYVF